VLQDCVHGIWLVFSNDHDDLASWLKLMVKVSRWQSCNTYDTVLDEVDGAALFFHKGNEKRPKPNMLKILHIILSKKLISSISWICPIIPK